MPAAPLLSSLAGPGLCWVVGTAAWASQVHAALSPATILTTLPVYSHCPEV